MPLHRSSDCQVLLLGDLAYSFEDDLRQLLHCRGHGALQRYFEEVNMAFRQEFADLPREQRDWLPQFTTLIDLMEAYQGLIGEPALKSALLCIYQVGRYIYSGRTLTQEDGILIGACTGSFAAAAIATSHTVTELMSTGVEAALVAFRAGWRSLGLQRDIEPSSAASLESWSLVVSLTEPKALEVLRLFNAEASFSRSSRPYLSAITATSVTISGPPRALKAIGEAFALKTRSIPICSPYHAPHLNGPDEVEAVLGRLRAPRTSSLRLRLPLLSASLGRFVEDTDFRALLRLAIEDTICRQIRWDLTCSALTSKLAQNGSLTSCVIYPLASNAASLVGSALRKSMSFSVSIAETFSTSIEQDGLGQAPGKFEGSKIAVVGFSGRYPEAASNEELWEVLKAARDCHRTIPEDRFDWKAHYDPQGQKKNHSRVKFGCFITDPGLFDARFFNLSPREAENTDPAQRLALLSAYEAIEMAGLVPGRTPSTQRDRVGVFYGVTSDDWREVNSGQNVDTYFIPGGNRAFIPGRISYFFRFSGPSISVDTACSSSFTAIATACKYLWHGECDTAIAGGANILTNPDNFVGLDRGHFLSTTGNCNPFDNSASGYCRADAVGSVVLKRLEDAVADNDPIFGVIADASTNHCGQTVSITRPHEGDQLALFRRMLRDTNTDPSSVGYVEMHGTGTQAGDAAEMRSVLSAFAPTVGSRSLPLYLGAVKSNVGHAEAASGVTALIKVLMMMQHSEIPPHRLDGELNKSYPLDLAKRNVHIAFKPTPWRREDAVNGSRTAFLNNFSAAGGNTALLLQDAPLKDAIRPVDPQTLYPVVVSARTSGAFAKNIKSLLAYLEAHADTSLQSLSYTTTARRAHYGIRYLASGADIAAIKCALQRQAAATDTPKPVPAKAQKPVFVFSGQGTLYSGIAQELFRQIPVFRADVLRLDRIAQSQGFPSFVGLVVGDDQIKLEHADPVSTQLAQCCVQMALSHLWSGWIGKPCAVMGHSLGEYPALYTAGVISATDTIYLVGSRARLLVECCTRHTHSMLAIKAPLMSVQAQISQCGATIACINSPTSVVASGSRAVVLDLAKAVKESGTDSVLLDVPFAFHSAQIEPILPQFDAIARTVHFRKPNAPYISPLLREVVKDAGVLNASYLVRAARDCVDFHGAIEAAMAGAFVTKSTHWVELGTHPACSIMLKQSLGSGTIAVPTLRKDTDSWKVTVAAFEALYQAGADIHWNEVHRAHDVPSDVLPLPSYGWELKKYWIQYRHNFCLTKGDDPATFATLASAAPSMAISAAPLRISSSVHRVVEERSTAEKSTIVTESELLEHCLAPVVSGHKVNTAQLCPSSLYADMALTVVKHMLRSSGTLTDGIGLDCGTMSVQRPLIVKPDATSLRLRVSADAHWERCKVDLSFFSVGPNGRKLADHATCVVSIFKEQDWLKDWKRQSYFVSTRMSMLRQAVETGDAHNLKRGLAYKLFSSLVDYSPQYQGMDRVILDSTNLEATAQVSFQVGEDGFDCNPCWIDSLGHIAGFIMNGNDNLCSKDRVFVNHGWKSMRCAKPLENGKTYTTYNRMQLEDGTMYVGDTYIFEKEELIGIFGGVKFQGVPRSVLDQLLPSNAKASADKRTVQPSSNAPQLTRTSPNVVGNPVKIPNHPAPLSIPSERVASKADSAGPAARESGIRKVFAEEAQLSIEELDLLADFNDLGIDSLLTLTIAGRLQEELDIKVSPSAFADHPTVSSFTSYVLGAAAAEASSSSSSQSRSSGASTPVTRGSTDDEHSSNLTSMSTSEYDGNDVGKQKGSKPVKFLSDLVRRVIAEETGTTAENITPETPLDELGVDSLLALNITSVLSEHLDRPLLPSLFSDSNTFGDLEKALFKAGIVAASAQDSMSSAPKAPLKSTMNEDQPSPERYHQSRTRDPSPYIAGYGHTPPNEVAGTGLLRKQTLQNETTLRVRSGPQSLSETSDITTAAAKPTATSVVLQGSPKTATKQLFFFPDGAGSAMSYCFLPDISPDIAVYGLNCPWLKNPQDMKCTLEHYVAKFIVEIRRRQPNGPYFFGGASAGGILAYEAAQQLESVGEKVEKLILLDSPDPIGLENPNQRMYDFLSDLGMFGMVGNKTPSWLRPHFDAFLALLDNYIVLPFAGATPPQTHIIYAKDGMCKHEDDPRPELRDDDPREMLWLLNNRTDFTGAGWNKLLGSNRIHTTALDDVNHYTILQEGPVIHKVSRLIARALAA